MNVGVNFDGVKVEVYVEEGSTVRAVIKAALKKIFPPESLPPVEGCVATLRGRTLTHGAAVFEMDFEGGHLLSVTLPF